MRHSICPPARQRGAALLAAMVIVTMVTTIAAGMVWQQWRAVQVEAAERSVAQSQWILRGALDWAKLILKEDKPEVDHLGEPWAVPLAEARLSSFLAVDKENNTDDGPEAFLSGQVTDLTAKYNLARVINADGNIEPAEVEVLKKLCEFAGISPGLADGLAQSIRRAKLATLPQDPEILAKLGGAEGRNSAPLMPQTMDQLIWLGLDAGTIERLRPYVTLLPKLDTTVNINTAPREVLAAVIDKIDLGRADRLVQVRQRTPFNSGEDVTKVLGQIDLGSRVAFNSQYFEIQGRLRLEDRVIQQRYVVQRNPNRQITVLFENRADGIELLGSPAK